MLTNANITSMERRGEAPAIGEAPFAAVAGFAACRGLCAAVTRKRRYELGATISMAEASVRIATRSLAVMPLVGDRLTVQVDGREAVSWSVVHVTDAVKSGGMSSVTVFLGKV